MTGNVIEAVNKAREFFEIKEFPGNFFKLLEGFENTNKDSFLLFKEDIAKLSGFIGYGKNDLTVICINYKRSIGHQNFILAHELGHWFLHKGMNISDDDKCIFSQDIREKEASDFAAELLYPEKLFVQDYFDILAKGLLDENRRKDLAEYIDSLCHKYCLSFEMVLRKILYKHRKVAQYKEFHRQIVKSLGCKISEYFDKDFYVPNEELEEYQQSRRPYELLEEKIDRLVNMGKIGAATAESLKYRNGIVIK